MARLIGRFSFAVMLAGAVWPISGARADSVWNAGIGDWNTASNWTGGEPRNTSFADINNGGTAQIGVSEYTLAGVLDLGQNAGQSGSVSMTNGQLTASTEDVGLGGTGTFTQSGGTNNLSTFEGILGIGNNSSKYVLSGTGVLNSGGFQTGGPIEAVNYGEFDQSGGTNNAPTLYISYSNSGRSDYDGIYRLSGGALNFTFGVVGGYGTSLLAQTGGTILSPFSSTSGPAGVYIQTGGTFSIANASDTDSGFSAIVQLTNGGTFALAGASGTSTAGFVTVGQYKQQATAPAVAELDIGIGGKTAGTGYGQLDDFGPATLSGNLVVTLSNNFVPTYGQVFTIIEYTSHTGTFDSVSLPSGSWGSFNMV